MKLSLKYTLIFFLLFNLNQVYFSKAQDSPKFFKYTTVEGLSQGTVNCIIQDGNGFLWFGTDDGLNKFDGYNFTVFLQKPGKNNSISNNIINDLVEGKNGIIWIATEYGLNSYNTYFNKFTHYIRSKQNTNNTISDNFINCLLLDKDDILWIGTENGGLNSYNIKTNKFTLYLPVKTPGTRGADYTNTNNRGDKANNSRDEAHLASTLQSKKIKCLYEDKYGIIWIGTYDDGLFSFNKKTKIFKNYKYSQGYISWNKRNNDINVIYEDSKNNLWIGTNAGGVNLFDRKTGSFKDYGKYYKTLDMRLRNQIHSIIEDQNGKLWVATYSGLTFYNNNTGGFNAYYKATENPFSLSSNRIISLFEDKTGSLWIGTFANGINVFHSSLIKFSHYKKEGYTQNCLRSNLVHSFWEDKNGLLFIGTWGGGLHSFNRNNNIFKNYNEINSDLNEDILAIYEDKQGILWLGTWGGGLQAFDRKNNIVETYIHIPDSNSISNNTVICLYEDKNDILWFGTFGGGLNRYDKKTKKIKAYTTKHGLGTNKVTSIIGNNSDTLWIGTKKGGFSIFNKKTGVFKTFTFDKNNPLSISDNTILHCYKDRHGNIWISTKNGLNKFNKQKETFTRYFMKDGLPNNNVYATLEDEDGYLWISTNKGVCRFNPNIPKTDSKAFRNFDVDDGLQSNEFNQGAYFVSERTGEMFFGGTNGFNAFFPKIITENTNIPTVHITLFEEHGKKVELDTSIVYKKRIKISYKENFIAFEFVALDYIFPEKLLYSYKMENLDDNWSTPSARRYKSYPDLAPGNYIFKVKAVNNDGIWNDKGTQILIRVTPPFWQTAWFIILTIIIGIALVFLFIRIRTQQIEKEKKILENKVAQRTKLLQQKNLDITSSIQYAKRIQEAILPTHKAFLKEFSDSFILYKPRDIVSGDFFWFAKKKKRRFFAAVDCTGHGVPGAFMSLIANNLLYKIILEKRIYEPAKILNQLHIDIKIALNQKEQEDEGYDGMDIALCAIDDDNNTIEFAGAYRPLYLISKGELTKIKGNKITIGDPHIERYSIFLNQTAQIQKGDALYLFSDGYTDQFGGKHGKKFMLNNFQNLLLDIQHLPMKEQDALLDKNLKEWMNNQEQVDDIIVVGIRF